MRISNEWRNVYNIIPCLEKVLYTIQYIYVHESHVNITMDIDSNEPNDRVYF